jgi:glucose/arabinose dehydrogenase
MSTIAYTDPANLNNSQQEQQQSVELSTDSASSVSKIIVREIGGFDYNKHAAFSRVFRLPLWCMSSLLYLKVLFELSINNADPYAIVFPKRIALVSYGVLFLLIIALVNLPITAAGQAEPPAQPEPPDPLAIPEDELPAAINDEDLRIETVATGLIHPAAMAFLGSADDILVIEKDNGTVRRIIDGQVQQQPLLDVAVANDNATNERGLFGLAVAKQNETTTYVFLYFTESGGGQDGDDAIGILPTGNRLYRYELVENAAGANSSAGELINPKLLLDLPARPGPRYNGGPLLIAQGENNATILYLMIGDLDHHRTQAQNYEDGPPSDGTGGILRIDIEGNPLPNPVLVEPDDDDDDNSNEDIGMLPYYFAYGIRNSFGMTFDPVTGYLWDTENGPEYGDEINLVQPGFNSGWDDIQGLASAAENQGADMDEDLEDFGGIGSYSDPKFVWQNPVGVTAIKFLNSTELGVEYENDLFVGDINNGRLYHFELNEDRTDLIFDGILADKVANNPAELYSVIFGTGFRSISDIEVGPDGNLYLLLYGPGKILRIVPDEAGNGEEAGNGDD